MSHSTQETVKHPDWLSYHPALIRLQQASPHPLGRRVLWILLLLLAFLLAWSYWGRLDIVTVAEGRLIPAARLQIIQPSEAGVIREIRVREGNRIRAGEVLIRMDSLEAEADTSALLQERARLTLTLERIKAELSDNPFQPPPGIPKHLVDEARSRYTADENALATSLAEEQARLAKAEKELAVARQRKEALELILPYYRKQETSLAKLVDKGGIAEFRVDEQRRQRIEKEQELAAQEHLIAAAQANITLSEKKRDGIRARNTLALQEQQQRAASQLEQVELRIRKQKHRESQLLLRAPQDGIVKELATHTVGTVVQPGTILASLIPDNTRLQAEIWLPNEDIGFVHPGQEVQLKLASYPFQKYGLLEGHLSYVSPDAQSSQEAQHAGLPTPQQAALRYRGLVDLPEEGLRQGNHTLPLFAGMRVNAEIRLGTRTVAEYLLSPISKAWHEAGHER